MPTVSVAERVWFELRELFEHRPSDDPDDDVELWLNVLSPHGLVEAFAVLWHLPRARLNASTWHVYEDRELTEGELGDCAKLIADGRVASAHFVITEVAVGDAHIPLLQFFLEGDGFQFHWWPATDGWNPSNAYAFVTLLARLRRATGGAEVRFDPRADESSRVLWDERFAAALNDVEREHEKGDPSGSTLGR